MSKTLSTYLKLNIFKGDKGIWMIYFLLCMISLVAIYSASSALTFKSGNHWDPVVNQAAFLLIGLLVILATIRIPCKYFKLLIVFLPIVVGMLVYMVIFQKGINDAARWMDLFGIKFQPSEMAKTFLILSIAVVLSKMQKEEKVKTKRGTRYIIRATKGGHSKAFKIVGSLALLICGLIAPENFSTAAMLFFVVLVMMFIGNVPISLMLKGLGALFAIALLGVVVLLNTPDEKLEAKRLKTWKHRIEKKLTHDETLQEEQNYITADENRQVYRSHIAIANSGFIGVGVGNSVERDFLPHAESDFIFSIIVEETGVVGALIVILLYLALLVRVGRIAQKCDRFFPAFLIIGLGLMMVLQALVNMAVAVGWAPVTGQTLPLISHGGTSIIITSFNLGMILSVSRYAEIVSAKKASLESEKEELSDVEEIASNEGMA